MQLQNLTDMLHTRMHRKDFLRTIGLAVMALVGLGFIAKHLRAREPIPTAQTSAAAQPARKPNGPYGA